MGEGDTDSLTDVKEKNVVENYLTLRILTLFVLSNCVSSSLMK